MLLKWGSSKKKEVVPDSPRALKATLDALKQELKKAEASAGKFEQLAVPAGGLLRWLRLCPFAKVRRTGQTETPVSAAFEVGTCLYCSAR